MTCRFSGCRPIICRFLAGDNCTVKCQVPKGLTDIIPNQYLKSEEERWRASETWTSTEAEIRSICKLFQFSEVRTPIFERTELFLRGIGEGTDIVSKEMYTFDDKAKRSMTLRPEGTAPALRAFIEGGFEQAGPLHKLFYIGPMFRYERPQAGRYRQHHQFGVEAIGPSVPEQDAEVIDLLYQLLSRLGIGELTVGINCLGNPKSRGIYRNELKQFLHPRLSRLSEDSQRRFEANPLRILDSKEPMDMECTKDAPSILDCLDAEDRDHFEILQQLLKDIGIPFTVQKRLVRGLDYYNGTVFEVTTSALGAQNSIGGGGRYDGLIRQLGGSDLAAMGFGVGIERLIQTLLKQNKGSKAENYLDLWLIPMGPKERQLGFQIIHKLRARGLPCGMDTTCRKLKKAMAYAHTLGAKRVAIIGENEVEKGAVRVKTMNTGVEETVLIEELG